MEQIKNILLGPLYSLRLEDLGRWDRFRVNCGACGHSALLNPADLRHRWPGYSRVLDLQRKLRCTLCGNRSGNRLNIGRLTRD